MKNIMLGMYCPGVRSSTRLAEIQDSPIRLTVFLLAILFYSSVVASHLQAEEGQDSLPPITKILISGSTFEMPFQQLTGGARVLTKEELSERSIFTFQQAISSVPGLQWAGGTATPRFFQIRGIGELEQYQGAPNPSVGVIVDGIDYSGIGLIVPLFDIEQIEVLKGPQGIRFGSSALAGAISLQSTETSAFTSGQLQLATGNDDYRSGAFAIGGSVPGTSDRLQLRISSTHSHQDGFRDNQFLGRSDTNERDQHTTRIKIKALPSDNFSAQLTTLLVDNNNGFDAFSIDNSLKTQSDKPGADQVESRAGILNLDYNFTNDLVLKSITSHARTNVDYSFDGDWGNNPFWQPYAPYDYFSATDRTRTTSSQEFRLMQGDASSKHDQTNRSILGIFAQRLDEDSNAQDQADSLIYNSIESSYQARTGAVFGEVSLPLGNGRSFEIGSRIERRLMNYRDDRPSRFNPSNLMWAGHSALKQDLSDDVVSFLQVSRGFKGGGFNPGTRVPTSQRIYDPESQWNFELGLKGAAKSYGLTFDASLFHALRRDAQLKFAFQDDPSDPLSFTYLTESVARGQSTGIESGIEWQANQRLKFFSQAMAMESNYTAAPEAVSNLIGRSYSHAPNWQFTVGTQYDLSETLFIQSDLSRQGAFYFDDSHDQASTPYSLLNVSAGYRSSRWTWTFWVKNLLGENYPVRGFFFGNEPPDFSAKKYVQRGDPVFFGTTLSLMF